MADICKLVRTAVKARLSDATYGFNAALAQAASSYGIQPFDIDFGSDRPRSFFYGRIPPDLIESSGSVKYPALTIDTERGQMLDRPMRLKSHQFSGTIFAVIEVHYSWSQSFKGDLASAPDAIVDAMYTSMNSQSAPNSWGTGVVYNLDLNWQKSPILPAGQHWRRTVTFVASFGVHVQ